MTLRSRWRDLVHRLDRVAGRPADPAALTGRSAYRRDERPVVLPADEPAVELITPRGVELTTRRGADARGANPDLADIRAEQLRRMRRSRRGGSDE